MNEMDADQSVDYQADENPDGGIFSQEAVQRQVNYVHQTAIDIDHLKFDRLAHLHALATQYGLQRENNFKELLSDSRAERIQILCREFESGLPTAKGTPKLKDHYV